MNLVEYGVYKVKDQYFEDFPSLNDKYEHNKNENRPYILVKDKKGGIWMVPMNSHVEEYEDKIKYATDKYGKCIKYFILDFKGGKSVTLIGNMVPVLPEYIKGEFTVRGRHYILKNEKSIMELKKRVKKYLELVRRGKMRPSVDILATEKVLLERLTKIAASA